MSDKQKKIDKEFLLTDDSVNCYGFRLMTSGYDLDAYKRSPIGYYMHDRNGGVVVRWDDFRTDGDKVYAKPVINMSHPRAQQTVDEIENGFLNAASVGHIIAQEYSDDPALKAPGQTGPTVTKWFNRECSLVDVPGNFNALALYDADENPINLADFSKPTIQTPMSKTLVLTAITLAALKLPAEATQEQADQALADLVADNTRLTGDLSAATAEKATAEKALTDLQAEVSSKEVTAILDKGLADKKTTVELNKVLAAQYAGRPAELKAVVDAMPAYAGIVQQLSQATPSALPKKYEGKTWDDLHTSGELADLRANYKDAYKELYKAKFNKEPEGYPSTTPFSL